MHDTVSRSSALPDPQKTLKTIDTEPSRESSGRHPKLGGIYGVAFLQQEVPTGLSAAQGIR